MTKTLVRGQDLQQYGVAPPTDGVASAGTAGSAPALGDHVHPVTHFPPSSGNSVTSDIANLSPSVGGRFVILSGNGSPHNVFGMVAGQTGEARIISNDRAGSGGNMTLKYNSASASAGNRFAGNSGADKVLVYQQSCLVIYDGLYWVMVS